jgi:hypothetical protein
MFSVRMTRGYRRESACVKTKTEGATRLAYTGFFCVWRDNTFLWVEIFFQVTLLFMTVYYKSRKRELKAKS